MKAISLKSIKSNQDFRIVLVATLYIVSVQAGLLLTFPDSKAVVLWPASGLALALLLIYGKSVWPAIAIGSLLAGVSLLYHYDITLNATVISLLLLFMAIHTFEAVLSYFLIIKLIKRRDPFLKTQHLFLFFVITLLITLTGASISSVLMVSNNILTEASFLEVMTTYFSANWAGILIFTPLLICFNRSFNLKVNKYYIIETIIFVILLAAALSTLTIESIATTIIKAFPFLVMPFLLWLAFRSNSFLTMLGVLTVSIIAIHFTIQGQGPFVLDNEKNSLLILQIFLGITSMMAIVLNTTVRERTEAEIAIREFNEKLEENVQRRTKELKEEISIRRATEEKMKVSNIKLRKANAELDNFVYSVSHDLRAPIASVLGLANLAKQEKSLAMMKKYISMIENSAEKQDAFIKDILDLSRNSRLEVSQEPIFFEDIINEIFDELKYYQEKKTIHKEVKIDQTHGFHSDKKRLKVIFNNLISNAIRYSNGHDPIIKINVAVNDVTARVRVQDNGIGIDKKHLKNIFKMFYRATEDNAGSGLGLYIVKETVDKLRGNVSLESELAEGTTVNLELPNLNAENQYSVISDN
ncbi:MAG: sensor histidine kinase [Candidatus Cyclobacteriaceae bacterium M2_1C_046]